VASPDVATRLIALAAIADFEGAPEVLDVLEHAIGDPQEAVRNAAIGFLAARNGGRATRILIEAMHRAEDPERVIEALCVAVADRVATLAEALETADDELAALLVAVLARTRRADADQVVRDALSIGNPAARKAAASVVAAHGRADGMAALRGMADEDPDPEVRRVAALLLSQ
jgi:HEAT repeat protein